MKARWTLLLGFLVFSACETAPRGSGDDMTVVHPDFASAEVIDIAVIPPDIHAPDRAPLEKRLRATAHEYLIATKNYAVADDAYIDRALESFPGAEDPSRLAEATGADAVLLVMISQWETEDLLPKGRIYAGGKAAIIGKGQTYWERTFSNRLLLTKAPVTASNRMEISEDLVRQLTRDILSTVPLKVAR